MKVVYVAGPYRADSEYGVVQNIRRAEQLAIEVWKAGAAAICPHKNSALFGGLMPDETWLEGGMEFLRRSDAMIVVDSWEDSEGTKEEIELAKELGIPIFWEIDELKEWLAD